MELALRDGLFGHMQKHGRKWLAFVSLLVALFAVSTAVLLRPAEELAKDFPDSHPYTHRINLEGREFPVGSGEEKETVTYVFGLDSTKPVTYAVKSPEQVYPSGSGTTNFAAEWAMDEQTQQDVLDFCTSSKAEAALWEGLSAPQVYCFMADFKNYTEAALSETFPVSQSDFNSKMQAWMKSDDYASMSSRYGNAYSSLTGYGYDADSEVSFAFVTFNTSMSQSAAGIISDECGGTTCMQKKYDMYEGLSKQLCQDGAGCFHVSFRWFWKTCLQAFENGALGGVAAAIGFAFVVLVISTTNLVVGLLATLNVICIIVVVCGFLPLIGLNLGIYECIFIVMCVGLAVDYTVHLAHSYNESAGATREEKMRHALGEVGVSVVSGAITTTGAGVWLFLCVANFFGIFGFFILFTSAVSIFLSLFFLTPLLMNVGPQGTFGDLCALRKARSKPKETSTTDSGPSQAV